MRVMGARPGICLGSQVHGTGRGVGGSPVSAGGHGLQRRDDQCHSQPQRHQIFR